MIHYNLQLHCVRQRRQDVSR